MNIICRFLCLLLIPFCCFSKEFRVEIRNAAPQIFQDNIPVSSRMVYVSKTAQEIGMVSSHWESFSLDFSILRDCNDASLHLRFFSLAFRPEPEKILFSLIEVCDKKTGQVVKTYRFNGKELDPAINFWCKGKWQKGKRAPVPVVISNIQIPEAPDGALCVASQGDPNGKLGEFHLILSGIPVKKEHDYQIICRARADREQYLTASIYHQTAIPQPLTYPGTTLREQVKLAKEAGINFVTFPIDNIWLEPDKNVDYSALKRICQTILEVNPQAQLIPRVDLRVPPKWWREKYPEELMKFSEGKNDGYPAISSIQYRKDAANALRGVIRFCEKNFKENMAGYHPSGGNTHEWFYYRSQRRPLSGYDMATQKAWRTFLRKNYNSNRELKEGWQIANVTLDTAEIPSLAIRRKNRREALLSPLYDRPLIDFHRFLQQEMVDMVLSLAHVIREETGKTRLCVIFYGYLFELSAIANSPACSGHYALRRILDSPDIDIVAGPISYLDRQMGGGTSTMTAANSVLLAGKLWVNEDDTSTHTAYRNGNRAPGWKTGAKTIAESITLLRRNLAVATFRGFGIWWMDLFGAGWFSDPVLWELMKKFAPLDSAMRNLKEPAETQIAEIIDENSFLYLAPYGLKKNYNSAITDPLVKKGRADRNRTGITSGQFLLDDLLSGKVQSKLNIIVSAWALTAQQRQKLRAVSSKTPMFWCWAPGYLDLDTGKFSVSAVQETTGFKVNKIKEITFSINSTEAGIKLGLLDKSSYKTSETADPILSPVPEAGDIVLAEYENGSPAILLRPGKNPALFCGTTIIPSCLYRRFAEYAGAHGYTDKPAYVLRRGEWLSICAPEDGTYEIDTGMEGSVIEFPIEKIWGDGPQIKLFFKKGETRIFRSFGKPDSEQI